ncbi:MAG: hypothetical protein NXY57DRAFT_238022 [Lentinula lateritia]|nr:MAG: hypothetical protein NXY57DRAFT_238022 [Lentinula lateritia]
MRCSPLNCLVELLLASLICIPNNHPTRRCSSKALDVGRTTTRASFIIRFFFICLCNISLHSFRDTSFPLYPTPFLRHSSSTFVHFLLFLKRSMYCDTIER